MSIPAVQAALDRAFFAARTFNKFTDQPVTDATIHALYDLLKWGPTAMNCQPARYVFVRSAEAKARLKPSLAPGNADKTTAAPLTVIVATDPSYFDRLPTMFPAYPAARDMFTSNPVMAGETGFRNGTLQGAYLIIAARLLGLDCGPMSGFDADAVNATFFAKSGWRSNFLINLGYGDAGGNYPRGPRLSFDEAARIE